MNFVTLRNSVRRQPQCASRSPPPLHKPSRLPAHAQATVVLGGTSGEGGATSTTAPMCALSPVGLAPARRTSPRVRRVAGCDATQASAAEARIASVARDAQEASPQHATASLARHAATEETANMLVQDQSRYALCPDDPSAVRAMVAEAAAASRKVRAPQPPRRHRNRTEKLHTSWSNV